MNEDRYERSIDELELQACKWWPAELREVEQNLSVLPLLLDTQEQFISILKLANKENPYSVFNLIRDADFAVTLFLKHLIVLTDFGSEPLQRINKNFKALFPNGVFRFDTGNDVHEYSFQSLPVRGTLNNTKMRIDTKEHILAGGADSGMYNDLVMLLIYGAAATSPMVRGVLYKCTQYRYLGNPTQIEDFVRKNYIRVSKIMAGSTATTLGNVAQQYVVEYLRNNLGDNYSIRSNGTVPGVTQNDGVTLTTFDAVVDRKDDNSRHKKYVAVEITFQETTNSTIERKGGQARNRFEAITSSRNYIAYIVDGAGNFARRSAISVICNNSHCTVAFTKDEFDLLVEFIRERIG
ncbi:MAG: hypothetical protein ACLVCI_05690 [Varibaculum timonense]